MRSAIVIRHLAFEDLGNLQPVLIAHGFHIHYLDASKDDLTVIHTTHPDLLIILGGPIGVYEQDKYPFLIEEINLIRQRVLADKPTLGICLGAQLIAAALGAKVYPGHDKEIGWMSLELVATDNSLFRGLINSTLKVLHWHGDTFDLPKGAVLLAASAKYPHQAFSYGKNILALQFHLEIEPSAIEQWLIGHACEIAHTPMISVQQLREDTGKYAVKLQKPAVRFWSDWLSSLVIAEPRFFKATT